MNENFRNYHYNNASAGSSDQEPQEERKRLTKKRKKRTRKMAFIRGAWIFIGVCFAAFILLMVLLYNGVIGYMPPIEELKNPKDRFASIIYTDDGQEMGRFYRHTGNRVYADYDEISQYVIDALIATEDVRFEEHSGIDLRALGRAAFKTVLLGQKNSGGGSTITQQLAKQLYSPESSGVMQRAMQKPIEWMIAIKLERYYSKEEIIKMYLNQFDFLYNAVGIKSAAQVYFGKDAKDLNIQEAAMLVGMVKNPGVYNPRRKPERALERRNVVFDQMVKANYITQAEADSLKELPVELRFHRVDHKDGIAPYFREEVRRFLTAQEPRRSDYADWDYQSFLTDSTEWATNPLYGWIAKNPKADGSYYDIYNDGLRIYTTIDSRMQRYAEEAVTEHMRQLQRRFFAEKHHSPTTPYTSNTAELSTAARKQLIKNAIRQSERYRVAKERGLSDSEIDAEFHTPFHMTLFSYDGPEERSMTPYDSILYVKHFLRAGFMSMDPRDGKVKAYVGGPDFRFFQYDMVGKGRRQVGSTVKPYLYSLAMEGGVFTPCSRISAYPPVIKLPGGGTWSPRGGGGGMMDLRMALTRSNNAVSARLIDDPSIKPRRLIDYMHSLGITTKFKETPALSLGACEISLREMVMAYSAFANEGRYSRPLYVTRITDNNGNVLARFNPMQTESISRMAVYRILSCLLNVVDYGTGKHLRVSPYNFSADIGGKTGTTNNNSDAWFMGFTPELVNGAWVGGEERYIHFNSGATGSVIALPIWGRYMKKVYADKSLGYSQDTEFVFPEDVPICDHDTGHGGHRGGGGSREKAATTVSNDMFE